MNEGPLTPMVALLGYRCAPLTFEAGFGARLGGHGSGSVVLMSHEIVQTGNGVQLGAGRPLSATDIDGLVRLLEGRAATGRLLPESLLLQERGRLAWFRPAARRRMYFRPSVGKPFNVTVWWPNLVFEARRERLRVAAYAGRERPRADTPLFVPPLMNVSDDGLVCRGSANEMIGTDVEDLARWEAVIYDTNFSHVNSRRTLRSRKDVGDAQHLRYWRAKARRAERVKAGELTPMDTTLAGWLGVR
jgi:PRTRC genetic system protein B